MLSTDEDTLRDLMHRCTDGLLPPASIAVGVAARERRRHIRRRTLSLAASGAAIGTAAGVAIGVGAAPRQAPRPAHGGHLAITLTAEQRTLYRLSATAAGQAEAQGRYAVLSEKQDSDLKTSIIDSLTGDTYAYQKGPSGPNGTMPVARHWSPTQAQFNDMPTDPAALRRLLIAQYDEQFNQSAAAITSLRKRHIPGGDQDGESDAGKVFQQASGMLWNPLVGPQLRAALFRVLATTPGVTVDSQAKDSLGRPAVEISWTDPLGGMTYATYENPTTTSVLEQTYISPPGSGVGVGVDLYLSVTRTNTIPPDPYGG